MATDFKGCGNCHGDPSLKLALLKGRQSPTPPEFSSTMGESEAAWVKYANAVGVLALLTGIIYFNPLGGSPSLPTFSSISSIPLMFGAFRLQSIQGAAPLVDLPATLPNGCPAHKFKSVRHLSRAPDIMVIEGFLSSEEADALLELAYLPPSLPTRANLVIPYLKSQRLSVILTRKILIKAIGILGQHIFLSQKPRPHPTPKRSFDASKIAHLASKAMSQFGTSRPCK